MAVRWFPVGAWILWLAHRCVLIGYFRTSSNVSANQKSGAVPAAFTRQWRDTHWWEYKDVMERVSSVWLVLSVCDVVWRRQHITLSSVLCSAAALRHRTSLPAGLSGALWWITVLWNVYAQTRTHYIHTFLFCFYSNIIKYKFGCFRWSLFFSSRKWSNLTSHVWVLTHFLMKSHQVCWVKSFSSSWCLLA